MAGKIATRGAYGKALVELAEQYPKLMATSASTVDRHDRTGMVAKQH